MLVGRMDRHYLFDAQDDDITNLQIKTLENANGRARVAATFDFPSGPESVEFHLRNTRLCVMYADYKVTVPEHYDPEYEGMELAELFANGTDGKRVFGAAIHFLCETDMATDAEKWRMLTHVLQMERGATGKPLDLCSGSGFDTATPGSPGTRSAGAASPDVLRREIATAIRKARAAELSLH